MGAAPTKEIKKELIKPIENMENKLEVKDVLGLSCMPRLKIRRESKCVLYDLQVASFIYLQTGLKSSF
jgi:hypothetical protein